MADDVTLGEVSRKLDTFARDIRQTLADLKADLRGKADATELADFRGELRTVHERVAVLEERAAEAKILASNATQREASERQSGQRRLSVLYGLALVGVGLTDTLVHVFVH